MRELNNLYFVHFSSVYLSDFFKVIATFTSSNTLLCGWKFQPAKDIDMHVVLRKHFFHILLRKCFLVDLVEHEQMNESSVSREKNCKLKVLPF